MLHVPLRLWNLGLSWHAFVKGDRSPITPQTEPWTLSRRRPQRFAYICETEATGDRRTDAWLTERADGVAAAMRELKMWVLSPGADTEAGLRTRIESDLLCFSQGRWREAPWIDPGPIAASQRHLLAFAVIRNLLLATAPLAGVLIADRAGAFSFDPELRDQAVLVGLAWASS